jgi:4-hydroxy-tetrahydrodipicolinate synthase
MQVTVGITHQSTVITRQRALEAVEAGAAAVMISPPVGSSAGPALHDHFARIAENLPIPVVVQDHPTSSGVTMPVDFIVGLAGVLPPGGVVKLEAPPTGPKTASLLSKTDAFTVLGGLGGVSLMQELEAGSIGTMTGFALPDILVRIVSAYRGGDVEAAYRAFEEALPVIVFEAQPGAGVGLRKEILRRRGAIAYATVRQPAPVANPTLLASLETLLQRLEMHTAIA